MSILSTGSVSLSLPIDLGPGLFQIDAHGTVLNQPDANGVWGLNAGSTTSYGLSFGPTSGFLGGASGDGIAIFGQGPSFAVILAPKAGGVVDLQDNAGNSIITAADLNPGRALSFYGGTPAAQQTLTSGTATPEQIALALEASTLMGGT